jgi:modulator of FtsH protease
MAYQQVSSASRESSLATNSVIRNTYWLLSFTLSFSAITAYISVSINAAPLNIFALLIGIYGLMFLTHKLSNSPWGLISVFAFTGFMGYTLGPILAYYLATPTGAENVVLALGMTAMVFFGLSGYALTTRKDFSFLGGFLTAGIIVLLCAIVVSFFFNISGLSLAISAGFVLFASAMILYETSNIIRGGQTNYILATISLYVAIYNLFLSLLHLLSAFNRD